MVAGRLLAVWGALRCIAVLRSMGRRILQDNETRAAGMRAADMTPGDAPTIKAMGDPAIREYLNNAVDTAPVVGSVCTGALVLAAAGLLEGRQATTHWAYHRLLERLGATYLRQRGGQDRKVIISAGGAAALTMALALVPRLTDEPTARRVQLAIEYAPPPPFGGIDWDQVDRDIYEPVLGPMVQQQLADRAALVAKVRGWADPRRA